MGAGGVTTGVTGKLRWPLGTALLSLIPFYWLVWYYRINRELRDFGRTHDEQSLAVGRPWLSVVAVSIGNVIVVPFYVSVWRTARRIQHAERVGATGVVAGIGVIGMLLALNLVLGVGADLSPDRGLYAAGVIAALLTVPAMAAVLQHRLNALWREVDDVKEG